MWGIKPWDNDRAADWFAQLMENTDFPSQVRTTLLLHHEEDVYGENTAKLRAAVFCMLQFGRVYVWPINELKNDLELAIHATEKILLDEEYCYSEEITDQIKSELEELKSRYSKLEK
jgi:hypothetical protein